MSRRWRRISRTRKAIGTASSRLRSVTGSASQSVVGDRVVEERIGEEARVVGERTGPSFGWNDSHEPIEEGIDEQRKHEERPPAATSSVTPSRPRAASRCRRLRSRARGALGTAVRSRAHSPLREDEHALRVGAEARPSRRALDRRSERKTSSAPSRRCAEADEFAAAILRSPRRSRAMPAARAIGDEIVRPDRGDGASARLRAPSRDDALDAARPPTRRRQRPPATRDDACPARRLRKPMNSATSRWAGARDRAPPACRPGGPRRRA